MSDFNLGKKLNYLSDLRGSDNFYIPDDSTISHTKKQKSTLKKKKKKKDIDDILDESEELIKELQDDDFDYDFETYIEDSLSSEEDEQLKSNLIGLGRKYARSHAIGEDESEISKAFAPQEKELNNLLNDVMKDKKDIQDDIGKMRSTNYGSNRKTLAEMVDKKTQLHKATLDIIKEKNNMKKIKFDIINKRNSNKSNDPEVDSTFQSSKIIQDIISGNHNTLLDSVGGRESIAGCRSNNSDDPDDMVSSIEESDDYIQRKYFKDKTETDADKFIEYENDDVKYILLIDSENKKRIMAENKYGDIVPDYPIPSNINELKFEINKDSGTATDQLNRVYEVRISE